MNSTNANTHFKPKYKGSKYSGSSEEYYKRGLEILNPPMKKFFDSLKISPKVLFIQLHKFDKYSANGCLYKRRNKSTIQFLTPSEVKQIAKKDVELMFSIMKRKVLSLGKLNLNNISDSLLTFNEPVDDEIFNTTFFKKKTLIQHVEENYTTCAHCERKFSTLTSLKHHIKTRHSSIELDESDEFDRNYNRNPLSELSMRCESKSSNEFSCDVLCCACLKIIVEVRPFLDSLVDNVCLSCLYCQMRISAIYFLYHIATSHLSCKQDECHSKYINTGYRLRQVLTMENEFECIHVDCDHYYFIDLNEPNIIVTVDDVDLSQIINCQDISESAIDFQITNNEETQLEEEKEGNGLVLLTTNIEVGGNVEKMNESLEECKTSCEPSSSVLMGSSAKSDDSQRISVVKFPLQCSICKINFQHEQKLLQHLFINHRYTFPYTCEICFACFKVIKELDIHRQLHITKFLPLELNSQNYIEKNISTFTKTEPKSTISDNSTIIEAIHREENFTTEEKEFREISESISTDNFMNDIHQEEKTENCCDQVKNQFSNEIQELTHQEEQNSLKHCKVKISCIVEKVEYPLDIHNLYAHIRKANNPTEINSSELRLETSFSSDTNGFNSMETSPRKRKISDTYEIKRSESTIIVESSKNFKCTICDKTFNSQRPYSEHMFFMHDAEFQDSVVLDILKSSPEQESIMNTSNSRVRKSQISPPPPTITTMENDKFEKIMPVSKKPKIEIIPSLTNNDNLKVSKNCQFPTSANMKSTKLVSVTDILGEVSILKKHKIAGPTKKPNLKQLKTPIQTSKVGNVKWTKVISNSGAKRELPILRKEFTELETANQTIGKVENVNTKKVDTRMLFACCDYKKVYSRNTMLENHRRLSHPNDNKETGQKRNRVGESSRILEQPIVNGAIIDKAHLTCPICKFIFRTTQSLQAHLMANHSRVTDICPLCNKLFPFGRGVRHILNFHIVPSCEVERKYEFFEDGDTKDDVNEAIKILKEKRLIALYGYSNYQVLHDFTSFKCKYCNQFFTTIRYYRSHYLQEHDKFCTLCDLFFSNNKNFLQHLNKKHYSSQHYLWFIDTFIGATLLTEKTKRNLSESFEDIIGRKLHQLKGTLLSESFEMEENKVSNVNENQINEIVLNNLPQVMCHQPESIVTLILPENQISASCETNGLPDPNVLQLPEFCMECEVSENGTLVMPGDSGSRSAIIVENLSDINNVNEKTELVNNSTVSDPIISKCILDYPIIFSNNINNLHNDKILTDIETNDIDKEFTDIQ